MKTVKTAGLFAAFQAALLTTALHAGGHGIEVGASEIISRPAFGMIADTAGTESFITSVSSDGRYVALVSAASNLVVGESNPAGFFNVFLFDRATARMTLVSHATGHPARAANAESSGGVLSTDGRYLAFQSGATDLMPGQTGSNPTSIFLYDRVTGTTALVSHAVSSPTTPCNAFSTLPALTPDGRFVAYQSYATDLVAGQTGPLLSNLFLWDRTTGVTSLVSHAAGAPTVGGDLASDGPLSLSADGRFALFSSFATDLVAGQAGPVRANLFLSDRTTGTTTLISHAAGDATTTGDQSSFIAGFSAEGRFVTFTSYASNLVPGQIDPFLTPDVFLWDRLDGSTVLLSHAASEPARAVGGSGGVISADEGTIGFLGDATQIVPGVSGPGGMADIILVDRVSGSASRAIPPAGSTPSNTWVSGLSADGRFVLISSDRTDLVSGQVDSPGTIDLFLLDRSTGTLALVSHTPGAPAVSAQSIETVPAGWLSADGATVVFSSGATNLVAGLNDTNNADDIFAYQRASQEVTAVTRRAVGLPSATAGGTSALPPGAPAVSADGRWVVFVSDAVNLVSQQASPVVHRTQVFLRDRATGITRLVSHAGGEESRAANAASAAPVISRDGRWVAFESSATDLVAGQQDPADTTDVFLYDRESGAVTLVSHTTAGPAVAGGGQAPSLSDDGDVVAFLSAGVDLVPGQIDGNEVFDAFLYSRGTGAIALVSHIPGSLTTAGDFGADTVTLSALGRFAVFTSVADNLTANDTNESTDVFVYDRMSGTVTLASHAAGMPGTTGNAFSTAPSISADGRLLVFTSMATDLVHAPGSPNSEQDIFLYDRLTDRMTLVSHPAGSPGTPGGADSTGAVISRDGGIVAFASTASNLMPGQTTAGQDIFLWNRDRDRTILASHSAASSTAGGDNSSGLPRLSSDGRWVLFVSSAENLVPGVSNPLLTPNGFLFDRMSGKISLVDHLPGSTTANPAQGLTSDPPALSADGRCAVYSSFSWDLVERDFNGRPDVFAACRGNGGGDD